MFTLGVFSYLQITFLPGYLTLRFLDYKMESRLRSLLYIFALSLFINYLLVYVLTLLHIYTFGTFFLIFIAEIVLLLFLIKEKLVNINIIDVLFQKLKTLFHFLVAKPFPLQIYWSVLIFLSSFFLASNIKLFFLNLDPETAFITGDAIDSYNKWAVLWAQNMIPSAPHQYPQLLPTNWSITYLFMQNVQVEWFAKLLMPLFVIGILFIFVNLAIERKRAVYLLGLIFTGSLFRYFFDVSFLRDGYMDIALAFFAFLTFYSIENFKKEKETVNAVFPIIFAFETYFVKELGVFMIFYTVLWFVFYRNITKTTIVLTLFLGLFSLLWLSNNASDIKTLFDLSIFYNSTNFVTNNYSYLSRIVNGLRLISGGTEGIILFTSMGLLLITGLFNSLARKVILFLILPLFLIWGFFLSYDQRNLAITFPFVGYAVAFSLTTPLSRFFLPTKQGRERKHANRHITQSIYVKPYLLIFTLLFFILALNRTILTDNYILAKQNEGKKQIGIPQLNNLLYKYDGEHRVKGYILTSYYELKKLPDLQRFSLYKEGVLDLKNLQDEKVFYFLYPKQYIDKQTAKIIEDKLAKGEYARIFTYKTWRFVEVRKY